MNVTLSVSLLLLGLILGCQGTENKNSSSSNNGKEVKDDDTGSSIYIPNDFEDGEVEEGASVANNTTGAYLTLPGDVSEGSRSLYVKSTSDIEDSSIEQWIGRMPLNDDQVGNLGDDNAKLAVFYHVTRSDGTYYGVLNKDSLSVAGSYVSFNLVGQGNYHLGVLADSLSESKRVATDDDVYTKASADVFTESVFYNSGRLFAGLIHNYMKLSTDDAASFNSRNSSQGLKGINIRGMVKDSSNNLIVATGNGIGVSTDNGDNFSIVTSGLPGVKVLSVAVDSSNNVYAGTEDGLAVFTTKAESLSATYTTSNGLGSNKIYSVAVASDGTVYVGTDKGAYSKSSSDSSFALVSKSGQTSANSVLSSDIRSVHIDSSARVLFGSSDGQMVIVDGGTTYYITSANIGTDNGQASNPIAINQIYVDSDSRIHLASTTGYFSFIYSSGVSSVRFLSTTDGLKSNVTKSVFVNGSTTYLGGAGGVVLLDSNGSISKKVESF